MQHCAVRSGLLPASAAQRARAAPPLRRRTRRSLSALPPLTAYCRHWALRTCRHEPLIFRRLSRVALHEICHMFGLRHCIFFKCLMNGTNCLQENDLRPPHLCPICLHKLQLCIGFDLVVRFQELRCPCFVLSSQPLLLHVLMDSLVCVRVWLCAVFEWFACCGCPSLRRLGTGPPATGPQRSHYAPSRTAVARHAMRQSARDPAALRVQSR